MSRKDMADYLGLTVETVSRLLTQMETGNLIRRISAQRIEVLDPGGLVHLDGEVRSTR